MIARRLEWRIALAAAIALTVRGSLLAQSAPLSFPEQRSPLAGIFAAYQPSAWWFPSCCCAPNTVAPDEQWLHPAEPVVEPVTVNDLPHVMPPQPLAPPPTTSQGIPMPLGTWRLNDDLPAALPLPLFVYSELQKRDELALTPQPPLAARTGVFCRMPILGGAEVQLGGGSEVVVPGSQRAQALPFQPHLLRLEGQCHWSLVGPIGVECQGTAYPALNPLDKTVISQDLRMVMPMGSSGQFRIGMLRSWEEAGEAKPIESTQFYGGFRLGW